MGLARVWREERGVNKKGKEMPLMHFFEILLLVAIVAGIFFGWKDQPVADKDVEPSESR